MIKSILINLVIHLLYYAIFFALGYRKSGGDMFIIIMTELVSLVHLIILLLIAFFMKNNDYYWGMLGVFVGIFLSLFILHLFV